MLRSAVVRQNALNPRSQFLQNPQPMLKGMATQSPTLHAIDRLADLGHLTEVLVPEHATGREVGPTFVHVQVGAADVGARDPYQDVGRSLDPRVRHVRHRDVPRPVVDDSSHSALLALMSVGGR